MESRSKPPSPVEVRDACLAAARAACDDALQRGLCAEGALEAALGAIEMLDIENLPNHENPQER